MQIENFDKIKQYVLTLGGYEDNPKLDLQIQMIIDEALSYCYRGDVPEIMELPLADVIVNEINTKGLIGLNIDASNVTSYKEGDMQVSFGSNSNVTTTTGATAKYSGKLEPFKQVIGVVRKDV